MEILLIMYELYDYEYEFILILFIIVSLTYFINFKSFRHYYP